MITVINVSPASAGTSSETVTVLPIETDYSSIIEVPQFDQANGALTQVTIEFVASVQGVAQVENLADESPSTGEVILEAEMLLEAVDRPAVSLNPAFPSEAAPFSLEAFDGTVDYDGPSGATFANLAGVDTVSNVFTDPEDLAIFTGTGVTQFSLDATALTRHTATAGNTQLLYTTLAGGDVNVTYQFEEPSIDIEKTPDQQTVPFGADVTFTIDVTNNGEADLVNVTVTDPVTPSCDALIGDLAVGETVTYPCVFPGATSDFTNVATVVGEDSIGNQVTDEDDAVVDVIAPEIMIEKTPDQQVVVFMGTATFTITVTNTGDLDLVNVVVTDPIAPGCEIVIGDLAVGESSTYECTVEGATEDFTNVATTTGEDEDGNVVTDDDDAEVDVLAPSIDIEKTPDDQTVLAGRTAVFTITVTNNGDVDLFEVTVTDPITPSCEAFLGDMPIGEVMDYECAFENVVDPFTNVATVTGEDSEGNQVTDVDDAIVRVAQPPPDEPELPDTGSDAMELSIVGWLLVLMGAGLVRYERTRTTDTS
jgi:uncharacterized repeat protein (TIGR01451 family)